MTTSRTPADWHDRIWLPAGRADGLVETFSRRDRQLFVDEVMPALRARNAAGA